MDSSRIKQEDPPVEMYSPPPNTIRGGDTLPTPPTSNPNYSPRNQTPPPHTNSIPHVQEEQQKPNSNPTQTFEPPRSSTNNIEEEHWSDTDDDLYGHNIQWPPRKRRRPYRPAYYYPTDHTSSKSKGCPVFEPTMEEFSDFYHYVNKIERYGMQSGIVKIVPPKEWAESLPSVSEPLKQVRLREPIVQHFTGSKGLFRQINIAKPRFMNPLQWKQMCDDSKYSPPNIFNKQEARDRESEQKKRTRESKSTARKSFSKKSKSTSTNVNDNDNNLVEKNDIVASPDSTNAPNVNSESVEEDENSKDTGDKDNENKEASETKSPAKGQAPKRKKMTQAERLAKSMPSNEEWENFDYTSLDYGVNKEDFTPEICKEIEKQYWRRLSTGESPLYGADMQGSLFTEQTKEWNVANLEDLFARLSPKEKIPGVNTPYLYFGMWRATFAWHVEDADLFSINYIHFGAPKYWYSIPQKDYPRFESTMAGYFAADFDKCHQFIRHKSFIVSPGQLAYNGIHVYRMVQLPGEFIITFPHGYHSGFNLGYNCAESINFATENWIQYGRKTERCLCVGDSVRIDIDAWLRDSEAKKLQLEQSEKSRTSPTSRRSRSVSAQVGEMNTPRCTPKTSKKLAIESTGPPPTKKEKPTKALPRDYPCVLCPDPNTADLSRIFTNDNKPLNAHKICAAFTPTMWVDVIDGEEVIKGYENIEKARWNLKCGLCSNKHGVKTQCTKTERCTRAFHVTCALQEGSGVVVDAIPKADGSAPDLVILCRQHNPAWLKSKNDKKREDLRKKVAQIEIGSTVKVRTSGVFEVNLKGNLPDREVIIVMFPDGKTLEISYKNIIWEAANNNGVTSARYNIKDDFIYEGPKINLSMSRGRSSSGDDETQSPDVSSVPSSYANASMVPPTCPSEYNMNGGSGSFKAPQHMYGNGNGNVIGGDVGVSSMSSSSANNATKIPSSTVSGSPVTSFNRYPHNHNIALNPVEYPSSRFAHPYSSQPYSAPRSYAVPCCPTATHAASRASSISPNGGNDVEMMPSDFNHNRVRDGSAASSSSGLTPQSTCDSHIS